MNNDVLLKDFLYKEFSIDLPAKFSMDEMKEKIVIHINELINHHFDQLVGLLYRIDINESALRKILHDHPNSDAAKIITEQIIARQLEKIKTRERYKKGDDIPDEERW